MSKALSYTVLLFSCNSYYYFLKEAFVETLKTFEEKITYAVEKIKILKEEKNSLEKKVAEFDSVIRQKEQEIERLASEKTYIKTQLEDLFNELDSIELK